MSRSDRDKIEAEREARRAKRLSDRAEQRARRKAEQAQRAAERAEELAARAKRRSPRQRSFERSIEDVVDDVAEKWTRKAEDWMDEQSRKLFDEENWGGSSRRSSKRSDSSSDMGMDDYGMGMGDYSDMGMGGGSDMGMGNFSDMSTGASDYSGRDEDYEDDGYESDRRRRRSNSARTARRKERIKRRKARLKEDFGFSRERSRLKRRNRNGNLYRNTQNKKIFGVCSGVADYWGMEAWQVRFMAVFGIFVLPSIVVPAYFIASFLMDDKPYYRKVTDRFHELDDEEVEPAVKSSGHSSRRGSKKSRRQSEGVGEIPPNPQVLRQAKVKFADIEDRLRVMESHVTSSKFELHRELKKISGDDV